MAISKQNMKKLEWLFADENKCDFIQTLSRLPIRTVILCRLY